MGTGLELSIAERVVKLGTEYLALLRAREGLLGEIAREEKREDLIRQLLALTEPTYGARAELKGQ